MSADQSLVLTVLDSWKQAHGRIDTLLASWSDEDLQQPVAPGRNRRYYLLGHLTAVNDRLLPLLRLGDRLHAELDEPFITNPDRTSPTDAISAADLRAAWSEVNSKLDAAFDRLGPEEWLERHDAISAEDFAKEPQRNRFAVLVSRTVHAAMHEGQMRLASH